MPNCSWKRNSYQKSFPLPFELFDRRTDTTDIWSLFWTTSAQLWLQFPKISGSKAKLQLYLHRTRFGTGPDSHLRTKSALARFQKFRIISTPRSGVPVLVFASSKTRELLFQAGLRYRPPCRFSLKNGTPREKLCRVVLSLPNHRKWCFQTI